MVNDARAFSTTTPPPINDRTRYGLIPRLVSPSKLNSLHTASRSLSLLFFLATNQCDALCSPSRLEGTEDRPSSAAQCQLPQSRSRMCRFVRIWSLIGRVPTWIADHLREEGSSQFCCHSSHIQEDASCFQFRLWH